MDYSELVQKREAWSRIVFVEPSCGDGSIISKLISTLPKYINQFADSDQDVHDDTSRNGSLHHHHLPLILGYDIDKNAIEKCEAMLSKKRTETHSKPIPRVSLYCCNFLSLTQDKILSHVKAQRKKDIDDKGLRFIFLGGPPYSTGCGSGENIGRDLPSQFVLHSIHLDAVFISFLLPSRCNFLIQALKDIVNDTKKENASDHSTWQCETHELEESFFNFQGRSVKQPSCLHCWQNEKLNTEGLD